MTIRKTLIFHFFIPDDYMENVAIKMHFECLKKYSHIFDRAIFYISATEKSKQYISDVRRRLFTVIDCHDVRIKVVENTLFACAPTFREEILRKLGTYEDEIIFWAHTKGATNVSDIPSKREMFLKWIYACYFYSLEFVDEVEHKLFYDYKMFYGSLLMEIDKNHGYYVGGFYWLNPMHAYNDLVKRGVPMPKMENRGLDEYFCSVFNFEEGDGVLSTHGIVTRYLFKQNIYQQNFDEIIEFFGEYDTFMKQYNEIKEKL